MTQLLGELEGLLDFPDLDEDVVILRRLRTAVGARVNRLGAWRQLSFGRQSAVDGAGTGPAWAHQCRQVELVNALSESERVLVDAKARHHARFCRSPRQWDGIPITLIDTAGERDDKSEPEAGSSWVKTLQRGGSGNLSSSMENRSGAGRERLIAALPSTLPHLIVWNKTDQVGCLPIPVAGAMGVSALNGWGPGSFGRRCFRGWRAGRAQDELLVTALPGRCALAGLEARAAEDVIASRAAVEMAASEVRIAQSRLRRDHRRSRHDFSGSVGKQEPGKTPNHPSQALTKSTRGAKPSNIRR